MAKITKLAIAKDALALLRAKRITATPGQYFDGPVGKYTELAGKSVQKYLARKTGKPCGVCARGALFCGFVLKNNKFNFGNYYSAAEEKLQGHFSSNDLEEIESAFEEYHWHGDDCFNFRKNRGIKGSYDGDDDKALEAILENIIAGKGKFDSTRYSKKYPKVAL